MRLFYAVHAPADPRLEAVVSRLEAYKGIRTVDPRSLHITLRFLGDTDDLLIPDLCRILEGALRGMCAPTVTLRSIGCFPSPSRPRVVWAGVEDEGRLATIAERIEDGLAGLGFEREDRAFRPHLTLARVKDPKTGVMKGLQDLEGREMGRFTVEDVSLISSELTPQGPIYRTVCSHSFEQRS